MGSKVGGLTLRYFAFLALAFLLLGFILLVLLPFTLREHIHQSTWTT